MSNKPLRDALKNLLLQDELNEQEFAHLNHLAKEEKRHRPTHNIRKIKLISALSIAAMLLVLVVASFTYKNHSDDLIQQRIAHEVFTNHLKIKALDIETDSFPELRAFFERLDFSPFFTSYFQNTDLKLIGARYCTLQGVVASQLRMLSPKGEVVTYYQALYEQDRFGKLPDINKGDKPKVIIEKGVEMSIWQENSVVTVLAQAIP